MKIISALLLSLLLSTPLLASDLRVSTIQKVVQSPGTVRLAVDFPNPGAKEKRIVVVTWETSDERGQSTIQIDHFDGSPLVLRRVVHRPGRYTVVVRLYSEGGVQMSQTTFESSLSGPDCTLVPKGVPCP